jgi:hypothetical protein
MVIGVDVNHDTGIKAVGLNSIAGFVASMNGGKNFSDI